MAKKLSYFNLIYGVCLFALLKSEGDWIILISVAIILLFNWIILKEVDGKYIISKSWLNGLMLLSFITSFLLLINVVINLNYLFKTDNVAFTMFFFILIRMLFVVSVLFHLFAHWRKSSLR